jgi:hypothetical protein
MTTNDDPPDARSDKLFRSLVTSSLHGVLNHAGAR